MADTLKNRERFSTTLNKDIAKALKEHSDKSMIPISKIVDQALGDYLKNHTKKD